MDNKRFLHATVLACALALGGCAGDTTRTAQPASGAEMEAGEAIAAAKAALATAEKTGFAWRDTGKMIGKAEKAAAEGDYARAIKLAEDARQQSILAAKQSRDQANASPPF